MSDQFLRKVLGEDGPNCGWGNDLESIPIFLIREKTKIHMGKLLTSTTYPFRTERNMEDDLSCASSSQTFFNFSIGFGTNFDSQCLS